MSNIKYSITSTNGSAQYFYTIPTSVGVPVKAQYKIEGYPTEYSTTWLDNILAEYIKEEEDTGKEFWE